MLVNNAAYQMTHETVEEIADEEWQHTFDTNITAMFRLVQAALPHLGEGASIINTSSINSDMPTPDAAAVRHHQGRDRQLHRGPRPDARRARHPGQRASRPVRSGPR